MCFIKRKKSTTTPYICKPTGLYEVTTHQRSIVTTRQTKRETRIDSPMTHTVLRYACKKKKSCCVTMVQFLVSFWWCSHCGRRFRPCFEEGLVRDVRAFCGVRVCASQSVLFVVLWSMRLAWLLLTHFVTSRRRAAVSRCMSGVGCYLHRLCSAHTVLPGKADSRKMSRKEWFCMTDWDRGVCIDDADGVFVYVSCVRSA